jgi:hypothetical protein
MVARAYSSEKHHRPSPPTQDRIRYPCVNHCCDNGRSKGKRRIVVDLGEIILRLFANRGIFQVLRKDRGTLGSTKYAGPNVSRGLLRCVRHDLAYEYKRLKSHMCHDVKIFFIFAKV